MVQIKNVAVFGGSGVLGATVLRSILNSGKFDVTIITRESSKSTFPQDTKVIKLDYKSLDSLKSALKGQDAVVSVVGAEGFLDQKLFFDAAIAAGVKRFLPSEFGCSYSNPKVAALPIFAHKIEARNYIKEKVEAGADITYTFVEVNAFLDWGLATELIFNWRDGKPRIYDGGDQVTSVTSVDTIGIAVVGVLSHYEETMNRDVFVHDIAVSQNQLLRSAQKADPQRRFEPVPVKLADLLQASNDALEGGDLSYPVIVGFILTAFYAEGYGQHFKNLDNDLLGIPGKTEEGIENIFKELYAQEKK